MERASVSVRPRVPDVETMSQWRLLRTANLRPTFLMLMLAIFLSDQLSFATKLVIKAIFTPSLPLLSHTSGNE